MMNHLPILLLLLVSLASTCGLLVCLCKFIIQNTKKGKDSTLNGTTGQAVARPEHWFVRFMRERGGYAYLSEGRSREVAELVEAGTVVRVDKAPEKHARSLYVLNEGL